MTDEKIKQDVTTSEIVNHPGNSRKKKWIIAIAIIAVIIILLGLLLWHRRTRLQSETQNTNNNSSSTQSLNGTSTTVPAVYQQLYSTLQSELDTFQTTVNNLPQASITTPLIYGSDLSYANNNIGPSLYTSQNVTMVKQEISRFKELGIGGIHLTIQWPQMSQQYDPDYQQYLAFYTTVAQDLRDNNIKIFLHNSINFGAPFSGYNHPVPHLTFSQYEQEKRTMVQNLITAIHPDYYILTSEPMTDAHNAGISELDDPVSSRALINFTINGDGASVGALQKGATLVGVGADTWESENFASQYITIPNLDFLSIHVYPFNQNNQQKLVDIVNFAHQSNKRIFIDEAWLYKTETRESAAEVYKKDVFGFFAPLDQQFLKLLSDFSKKEGIEFLSGFWARNFFSYIDYMPGDESANYSQLQRRETAASSQAINNDTFSTTGTFYKSLIEGK